MSSRQFILPLVHELVVDLFAGGGGASTGIEQAVGRHVDIAVNHDPAAVSLHQANHPQTRHFVSDVFEVDPRAVTEGRRVGLLWASPDCTFHSKARGGKPFRDRNKARRRRGLAWVVCRWAREVKPRVIALENVEEFQHWGPLLDDGTPCPERRGLTFRRWVAQLRNLGYAVEWRELRACDYGAPTIRKRLFLVARCDGEPIVWPAPTHGPGLRPHLTAASCIDWTLPCPSIFERERPLAEATLRRIAHGIKRYVLEAAQPFIAPATHQSDGQKHALVAAFLAKHYGGNESPGWPVEKPISTVTTQDHHHLVAAHIMTNTTGHPGAPADEPLRTITTGHHHAEVRALLCKYYGSDRDGQGLDEPLHTIPTHDRFGLVTVAGDLYAIADIGMRMLQPRELYRAQGFPESYVIDRGADGRQLSKAAQVRMCGNSVCPPLARAIVAANFSERQVMREAA